MLDQQKLRRVIVTWETYGEGHDDAWHIFVSDEDTCRPRSYVGLVGGSIGSADDEALVLIAVDIDGCGDETLGRDLVV